MGVLGSPDENQKRGQDQQEKVKEIEVHALESDADFAKNEGKFFDVQKDITIYDVDVDVYGIAHPDDVANGKPKRKLLAKFRKGVFSADQVQVGWDAFRLLAIPSRYRWRQPAGAPVICRTANPVRCVSIT